MGMMEAVGSNSGGTAAVGPMIATMALHLLAFKYVMLASFVVLIYDHIITFSDEVNRIWRRKWTGATWLFALNRYAIELLFIVDLVSYHDPHWVGKACEDFIPFPAGSALASTGIAEIILILRTYALFRRSKYILVMLSALWCGQIIVMGLALRDAKAASLPPGFVGCVVGPQGHFGAAFWLSCLTMDSIITILTVFKTTQYIRLNGKRDRLVHMILRDGLLYFVVILTVNLSNCLTYYLAPARLRVILASLCQCITSVMVSRLQLNLRSELIALPGMPMSEGPSVLSSATEPKFRDKQPDSSRTSTTLSSIVHFFQSTVTEMGRDVAVIEEGDRMNIAGAESDIEMGPVQLTRKNIAVVPAVCSSSPEEPARLESLSNATPTIKKS